MVRFPGFSSKTLVEDCQVIAVSTIWGNSAGKVSYDCQEIVGLNAKAASSLNHANICTVHEIDESDGRTFIAMELLEGQTLRHRVAAKPLEIETVLDLGIQIADALSTTINSRKLQGAWRRFTAKRALSATLAVLAA